MPKKPEEITNYEPIRNWVLACLCVAPEKGSPRRWAKTALTVTWKRVGDFEVKLWDRAVETPGLALTLLYWHSWRERMDRPEQSRLHRKSWAYSQLFPKFQGSSLEKQAMHDAPFGWVFRSLAFG